MDNWKPFITGYDWNPDYNDSDHEAEFQRMLQRNDVIEQFCEGTLPAEAVLETLHDQDIDPYVYVASVEEAVRYALEHPEFDIEIVYE